MLKPTELSGHEFNSLSEPTLYDYSSSISLFSVHVSFRFLSSSVSEVSTGNHISSRINWCLWYSPLNDITYAGIHGCWWSSRTSEYSISKESTRIRPLPFFSVPLATACPTALFYASLVLWSLKISVSIPEFSITSFTHRPSVCLDTWWCGLLN